MYRQESAPIHTNRKIKLKHVQGVDADAVCLKTKQTDVTEHRPSASSSKVFGEPTGHVYGVGDSNRGKCGRAPECSP